MIVLKKIISLLLSVIFVFSFSVFAFAEQDDSTAFDGTIKFVDFNVDGLPIPAQFAKDKKSPIASAKSIIEFINSFDPDIVNMQENFNLYKMYQKGLAAEYISEYSGGIAVGDGLGTASKFAMTDVKHIPWDTACGILDRGSDELTPKGFMVSTLQVADGVYIDVYNLHADANEDEGSLQAKVEQFEQLKAFIDKYSGDRAVIIAGDFNSNYTIVLGDTLREKFVADGFKDTWVECENNGDYYPNYGELAQRYNQQSYWGYFDCLDKIYYRDGAGISFEALSHEYVFCFTKSETGEQVRASDHAAIVSELGYTLTGEKDVDSVHVPEAKITFLDLVRKALVTMAHTLKLIFSELPALISGEMEIGWNK